MRARNWLFVTALVVSAGSALAQSEGSKPAIVQTECGADLATKADATVERLQNVVGTIQRQLDVARAERNVVKVLFLSEKLSQANASLRSAIERRASLKAALERGDCATAKQDSEVLAIIGERGEEFLNASNQAVGEGTRVQDEANVSVIVDPGTPSANQSADFPPIDPLTGAPDTNGRQASGQTGVSSSTATDVPTVNPNTIPDSPTIDVSTSPSGG